MLANLSLQNINFSYTPAQENLFNSLNLHFTNGWTGIVGQNGTGKSTLAKIISGKLKPNSGQIKYPLEENRILMTENSFSRIDGLDEFWEDRFSGYYRSLLKIKDHWIYSWEELSFGERKRIQIAVSLWINPDIWILDEPSNHLDISGKRILLEALETFKGIGILISHDRDLLDALCNKCIFLRKGEVSIYSGNYSESLTQERESQKSREVKYKIAKNNLERAKRSIQSLKEKEFSHSNSLSKKNIDRLDHDTKGKIDRARLSGKDKKGSRKKVVLENKKVELEKETNVLYKKVHRMEGFQFQSTPIYRDILFHFTEQDWKPNSEISIFIPELYLKPNSKIGIQGENGTGKSSFLKYLYERLNIPSSLVFYLPQEIDSLYWEKIQNEIRQKNKEELGKIYQVIYQLGSIPEQVFYSKDPSPGEKRKVLFGLGAIQKPAVLILDEPTNHLDLPSVHCLEDALSEYDGCIVLVSHDEKFLDSLIKTKWIFERNQKNQIYIRK
ncbi:MAG TPA: ATP-binding cassette domain-containing protein [Leptospiraceae bacterium]|nr:ATP-binding cassette domain-containing protein [Leptospiraceae bacterium]HMX33170.1 ATP-binding cassette domain-containing protein [Leptospiraceae bacterium]HMY31731.1 ATP-binding cassette domain-containing protein [Leptospiraceae bacterium]HMZ64524.1 ATP-binding cassette domain-containing protein [Leptospiraceae bacterium]HNA08381.1 ATP-binding cassette domain-containing protein [Leptospiraceae bacterium]